MKLNAIVAAGVLTVQALVGPFAMAGMGQGAAGGTLTGFVVPKTVGANEGFTFAAQGVVEGEVISIQTVEGEVVQTKKTDKFGRVFLAAGLAAGTYLLSRSGGRGQGQLEVQPPRNIAPSNNLSIPKPPSNFNVKEGLNLPCEGASADASELEFVINGKKYPALASTTTEALTGPLPASACGAGPVELKNLKTGQSAKVDEVVGYELNAKLGRQKLVNGEQTFLEFLFNPANWVAVVNARILSGPVSFEGGAKEKSIRVEKGSARAALKADPGGVGAFRVAYDLVNVLAPGKTGGSGSGDNKDERCPLTKHERMSADGWKDSQKEVADPDNPGKTKTVYMISRTVRCSIRKSCSKVKGHGGECAFTGASSCKDHTITETREFDSEDARKDGKKDTAIPPELKFPGE